MDRNKTSLTNAFVDLLLAEELSYSLRRSFVDEFQHREVRNIPSAASLLDLGGNRAKTRGKFTLANYPLNHVALNLRRTNGVDVVADAARVPLRSAGFDVVVCAEVLEHVISPPAVLFEVARVLKPGGLLLVTVPFLFRQHADPEDYGRYTEWFWQAHLRQSGFENVYIEKQGLFYTVLVDLLRDWARHSLLSEKQSYRLKSWLFPRLVRWARRKARQFDSLVERRDHPFWGQYTTGFGIRATKATSSTGP